MVKKLWLSDKLSNMRSFYRIWKKEGSSMWNWFHQKDQVKQAWYYRTIRESTEELKDFEAWTEYSDLVDQIFQEV